MKKSNLLQAKGKHTGFSFLAFLYLFCISFRSRDDHNKKIKKFVLKKLACPMNVTQELR